MSQTEEYKELTKQITQLHECLDGMRDEQQELKTLMETNFLGIEPAMHVRHHNALTDAGVVKGDRRKALYDMLAIIAATLLINSVAACSVVIGVDKLLASHAQIAAKDKT